MTIRISVYGASDDLVEIEVDGKAYDELPEPQAIVFSSAGKALSVDLKHDGKRGWMIQASIEDESEEGELPFGVVLVQEKYSPRLDVVLQREPVTMTWVDNDGTPRVKSFKPQVRP